MASSKLRKTPRIPRKKRKAVRYRKVGFKLTEGQKQALDRYCKTQNLTPVRFIKSLINSHVSRHRNDPPPSYATENQLDLFSSGEVVNID